MLDTSRRSSRIDKASISAPISARSSIVEKPDLRTPRQKALDYLISQIKAVDVHGSGVDCATLRTLCRKSSDEAYAAVRAAGGWTTFAKSQSCFKIIQEGSRTILYLDELEELRNGITQIMKEEIIDEYLPDSTTLSVRNQEILDAVPRVLGRSRLEFYKDVRKEALQFMRCITLLMRFRQIFANRSFEALCDRLHEEGDLKTFTLPQFLEMAVRMGFLKTMVRTYDDAPGHAATDLGADLLDVKVYQRVGITNESMILLEDQLLENYRKYRPTGKSENMRKKVVADIQRHLDSVFGDVGFLVEPFGSSGNGLYFPNSDVDICAYYSVIPPARTIDIRDLYRTFYKARAFTPKECVAHARIPVLKLMHQTGVPVDISIENTIAIENTRLIALYMSLDPRVKPLMFAIKVWAKSRAISRPDEGTLSSYSWTLMLIHYLQRLDPPVLPLLQDGDFPAFNHSYNGDMIACYYDETPNFKSSNTDPLGSVFVGFFKYFAEFDWEEVITTDENLVKSDLSEEFQRVIAIQDPFIKGRNCAINCKTPLARWIISEIERGHIILDNGGSFADLVHFAL